MPILLMLHQELKVSPLFLVRCLHQSHLWVTLVEVRNGVDSKQVLHCRDSFDISPCLFVLSSSRVKLPRQKY